jgi:hypothetical protein
MKVRITQLDGKLPNLALMKLSAYHKARGDQVHFSRSPFRNMLEPRYDRVYASAIFSFSADRVAKLKREFPNAMVGGTHDLKNTSTVEQITGDFDGLDYTLYPDFTASLGFTQRGCRLRCGFCVVPAKEGKPRPVKTVRQIWRGGRYPRHIHLLDNDFFGQPEADWKARIEEIIWGGFSVCMNQGINVRLLTDDAAKALSSIDYRDDQFAQRRLYTAWDNIGDEAVFFRGVDRLEKYGIPPAHLMAFMLIGYDRRETWDRVIYRMRKMADRGIRPYPMAFGNPHRGLPEGDYPHSLAGRTLKQFERYVVRRVYQWQPFEAYDLAHARREARNTTARLL